MFDNWLDTLLDGTFETNLPKLALAVGESVRFCGSGRLAWQTTSRIRVQAETDGAETLFDNFGQGFATPGQLIPHAKYLSASGRTQDGWDVTTIGVPLDGYRIHTNSPHVVWDFAVPGLQMNREVTGLNGRVLRALLGPPPKHWIRMTETEICNEFFGSRSNRLDWLMARTAFGLVVARLRSDRWFEVRVKLEGTLLRHSASDILNAVARAFGFALGRRIFMRGYEDLAPDREARCLAVPSQEPTRNSLWTPLGDGLAYRAGAESLLGRAIDFFLTDQGEKVAQHLYLCWDTADNALPTRLSVASICIEGLLRVASQIPNGGNASYTAADRIAFENWLNDNPANLTRSFVDRLKGFLGMLGQRRPVDVLRDWQRRELLGVTREDIEAWKNIRNAAAHAGLVAPAPDRVELQTRVSRFSRVVNLMNRIVLQLIGYKGQYVDYAHPQWAEVDFPTA